jgi:hypothetical protein
MEVSLYGVGAFRWPCLIRKHLGFGAKRILRLSYRSRKRVQRIMRPASSRRRQRLSGLFRLIRRRRLAGRPRGRSQRLDAVIVQLLRVFAPFGFVAALAAHVEECEEADYDED